MTSALTIALALCAFVASLAAFGGETWLKGDQPLRRRITKRGWLALACLLLTFGLAVAKEMLMRRALVREEQHNKQLTDANSKYQERLAAEVSRMFIGMEELRQTYASAKNVGVLLPPSKTTIGSARDLQNETISVAVSIALSGEGLYALKDYAGALQRFQEADRLGDIAAIKARIADSLFYLGNYAAAVEFEQRAMALAPEWNGPPYMLAHSLLRLNRLTEALAAAVRSCDLGFNEACKLSNEIRARLPSEQGGKVALVE
jgi:tetratricopeptide (TPR) repeat protein